MKQTHGLNHSPNPLSDLNISQNIPIYNTIIIVIN